MSRLRRESFHPALASDKCQISAFRWCQEPPGRLDPSTGSVLELYRDQLPADDRAMFVRPCWKPWDESAAYALVGENPWALLVENGDDGPFATNLPLYLVRDRGPKGTLVGHVARANDHARVLGQGRAPALAIFEGPHGFVTASWYPNRDMPGTWYYTAVHCYGKIRIQTERELEASLGVLNGKMEGAVPDGWRMDEVPHSEIARRLPSIVGFELEIERLEAKFKLGQDEPLKDALAVAARFEAAGAADPNAKALAAMVRRANADRPPGGA